MDRRTPTAARIDPGTTTARRTRAGLRGLLLAGALVALLAPLGAEARRYDSHEAGHPLRIVGYVGHAAGWLLDVLIFRPAWYIGQTEPIATIVGSYHNREAPDAASTPTRLPEPRPESDLP